MNTLLHINDMLAHAPAGVIAMLFSIALGYVLKVSEFFPNKRIPIIIVPLTAILFALIELSADKIAVKPFAGYYVLFNFMLGFIYGALAWLLHAQILRRFVDPKFFNDDGSTKHLNRSDVPPSNPPPNTPP